MLQLFLLALALNGAAPGERGVVNGPDPIQGPMAVTDKDLLKMSVPRCANPREEQRAMEARIKGGTPECLVIPRPRTRERLDQNQPHP
jgi:hypothetical protein